MAVRKGRVFFLALFILLFILALYVLSPYLTVILIALITVVMLKPFYDRILALGRVRGRVRMATAIIVISFILLIIVPLLILGTLFVTQTNNLLQEIGSTKVEFDVESLFADIQDFIRQLPTMNEYELDAEKWARGLLELATVALVWLTGVAVRLGTSLPKLFISAIIFLAVVSTLLPTFDELEKRIQELSPLDVNITQIYLMKGEEMILSVIKGVFLLTLIQGSVMGIFYWLAGIPFALFFTLLSIAFAILPVVGMSFIVLPMAIILLLTGDVTSAIIVLVGFYLFANPLDLFLRPKLVSKQAYLNFTMMMLALLGGMAVGGLLGLVYGPVIILLLITTIEIFGKYYSEPSEGDVSIDYLEPDPSH